ncbi:MAG TPA: sulfate ABC transporter permease subunit CysW [Acidocella sp.]|jgi:sulfate transport system permease protein|uniref:sulfate ABC transporter permease subunit CysW n=1 Tax=Acidocella sp. TaxID=50710 RepID=UPI002C6DF477|nr:sulfate ABC transporter permease subunit CysW [Acidocella sp.]HVE21290.1 sulfate ABC transporter permease subunit CysW [Acidocella sp.]
MVRILLITTALLVMVLFLVLPLLTVFIQALSAGFGAYVAAIVDPNVTAAIGLTLLIAAIAVPANLVFGIVASWCIARFRFPGRSVLLTLIDLPFSISPVVAGLLEVLLFGLNGLLGPFLAAHGVQIIFALPGMVLATIFVTFPFVAREVIPLAQEQGNDEEEAAVTLGASGLQIFWRVSLPKIRWGLFYGVLLCNARAMGEFGAVSVVSGKVFGSTDTLPLAVESLYESYEIQAAFAAASLLALLALATLVLKAALEWWHRDEIAASRPRTSARPQKAA